MNKVRNIWFTLSIFLASAVVITSSLAFSYYSNYVASEQRYKDTLSTLDGISYKVNIMIEYSKDSKTWYNQTVIPIGWSLFNATAKATGGKIEGQWYSWGVFVTSINSVSGTGPKYWLWFTWNNSKKEWVYSQSGADSYIMKQGEIVSWFLTDDFSATP